MATYTPCLARGIFITLLLAGLSSAAFAQGVGAGAGSPGSAGGETRGVTRLQGKVICVDCSVEAVRNTHPAADAKRLYELTHNAQRAVFQIDRVNEAEQWDDLTLDKARIEVRGDEQSWQELTDPANLHKEIELSGMLRKTGTLDLANVAVAAATIPSAGNGVRQERR